MPRITWDHKCHYCGKPITSGKPTLLLSRNEPKLIGIAHSTCCYSRPEHSHYQLIPPCQLTSEQVTFLLHYEVEMYKLPPWSEPGGALREALVDLLFTPDGLKNPIKIFRKFQKDEYNQEKMRKYPGDLEHDFLRFLGMIQRLTKEQPFEIEVDFGKKTKRG